MKNLYKLALLSFTLMFGATLSTNAQNARVQVIHNSPDALADSVDVYLNGVLTLDNFAFRTATPFLTLPSGTPQVLGIAPKNSTGYADTLVTFTYTLAANATYIIVADGVLNTTAYNPAQPFNLYVNAIGREEAGMAGNTDVLVHHGSTDAPHVDVEEIKVPAGTIVNNLGYTEFSSYLELTTSDYRLVVTDSTGTVRVKAYEAPLSTLGLADSAITVVASGFLNPANNSNGPAFGLFVALPTGGDLIPLPESTAPVQVVHNSSDALADSVDIYVNGMKAIDNFAYRTATPFIDLPAELPVNIGVAPKNSMGFADTLVSFNFTLDAEMTYMVVADGLVNPAGGYTPFVPFNLEVFPMARQMASMSGNTDVLVHHGSTDAPAVDVVETSVPAGVLVNNLEYAEFAGYLELTTADYRLAVQDSTGSVTVKSYEAPLSTLGLTDEAIAVIASGFLNPMNNANGPEFGLFAVLASGGNLVPLPESTSRVQVIHNSADAIADSVDIYINGEKAIDNFAFRTATPFIDLGAGVPVTIGVAPKNSMDYSDTLVTFTYTLDPEKSYIIVADGLVDASAGYMPFKGFNLEVYDMAREMADMTGNTDVLVHHGSTDAPTVDVVEVGVGAGTIVDDLAYTDFQGYLPLATADYVLEIRDSTGMTTVASYDAPLATLMLDDAALVVVASGFLAPANNNNGPAFGLWVALPSGGNLIPLPESSIGVTEEELNAISVFPNPVRNAITVAGIDGIWNYNIIDVSGRLLSSGNTTNNERISVEDLANGIYMFTLEQNGATKSIKIVK